MCGRYTLTQTRLTDIEATLNWSFPSLPARYNVAPGQLVPAIRQDAGRPVLEHLRWGLIPSWARDAHFGRHTVNARAETVAVKPAFRSAFRSHRCLLPADGFFEWETTPTGKQPWYFRLEGGQGFAFAGLWAQWTGPEQIIRSCTLIVTAANDPVGQIHERMPVILDPADYGLWLDPHEKDPERLQQLLKPIRAPRLEAWPVSRRVNSAASEGPDLIAPLSSAPTPAGSIKGP